jgi:hypothetical protein
VGVAWLLGGDVTYGAAPSEKFDARWCRHVNTQRDNPVKEQPFDYRIGRLKLLVFFSSFSRGKNRPTTITPTRGRMRVPE